MQDFKSKAQKLEPVFDPNKKWKKLNKQVRYISKNQNKNKIYEKYKTNIWNNNYGGINIQKILLYHQNKQWVINCLLHRHMDFSHLRPRTHSNLPN